MMRKLPKNFAAPCLALAGLLAPRAEAVELKPSPDGMFQQCVARNEFPQALQDLGHRPFASWDANKRRDMKNETWFVKSGLSVAINAPSNAQRQWIGWQGWDRDLIRNGKTPELYCVNSHGTGIIIPKDNKMPSAPFGYTYTKPARAYMGEGKFFFADDANSRYKAKSYPVILANAGNKSFLTLYVDQNNYLFGAFTDSVGATYDTIASERIQFAPNIREELALSEGPSR